MIGDRLREERVRIGATQADFSATVGAAKRTIIDWEKDRTSPTALQLTALAKVGVDVGYILTGERKQTAESEANLSVPLPYVQVDLMGRILEEVAAAYGERGVRIGIRNLGQVSAQIHNDIIAALGADSDPTEQSAALKMEIHRLKQRLSHPTPRDEGKHSA